MYACQRQFKNIVPEPAAGMPDVVVKRCWRPALSVEATTVKSVVSEAVDLSGEFHDWIYRRLEKVGVKLNGAAISTNENQDHEGFAYIPKRHRWPQLVKHQSWAEFVSELKRDQHAIWRCPEGGVSVIFEVRNNGYISGNLFTSQAPIDITKHPVYRAIRAKARQASKWPKPIQRRPIVLAICAPRHGSEFTDFPAHNEFSVDRAVWSALLDHERLSDLDRLNILRQKLSFGPSGVQVASNRMRVAGSRMISAVLFVRIEQIHDRAQVVPASRAIPMLYLNRHANCALTADQTQRIKQLDFNFIQYGPGWESWHGSPRESPKARNMRRGGSIEYRSNKEGTIEMRIPTVQLMKILSGEKSAQDVFADYGGLPNPIDKFRKALSSELSLQSISLVNPDHGSRDEQSVAFVFGPGQEGVIARSKQTN